MTDIDEEFLAERERIRAAATKGPWTYDDGVDVCSDGYSHPYQEKNRAAAVIGPHSEADPRGPAIFTDDDVSDADAIAIVDAVNSQPALIAEIRRLRKVQTRLVKMVERRSAELKATAAPIPSLHEERTAWDTQWVRFRSAPANSMIGKMLRAADRYIGALVSAQQITEGCYREAQRENERLRALLVESDEARASAESELGWTLLEKDSET